MFRKGSALGGLLMVIFIILALIGEIRCIVNVCTADWQTPFRHEAINGIAIITGLGCVVGYFNIPDGPVDAVVPDTIQAE